MICVSSSRRSLLDRNIAALIERPVDRAERQRHIEGHAVIAGGERLEVRADLIADIPCRRGSIAPDDDHIDLAPLHEMAAEIIGDHRVRHAVRGKLECRQRSALITWPGFVHPHVDAGFQHHAPCRLAKAPYPNRHRRANRRYSGSEY